MLLGTVLTFAEPAPSFNQRFEKYFADQDGAEQRWYLPVAEGLLIGSQNFWFVTPYDVLPGGFNMGVNKKEGITNFSEKSFEFQPNCAWGSFRYLVTALAPTSVAIEAPAWATVPSREVHWGNIPAVKDLLIVGAVTKVLPQAKGFEATITFKDGDLPVRFDVIGGAKKERWPDVHSRHYGPHWRHTFDVYYPDGFKPGQDPARPVLINIHGGGWSALDKGPGCNDRVLKAGIVYASINYRYLGEYMQHPAMTVPVAAPLLDAARAIQFIKYHGKELGIDPDRICLTGGSAGGASSAWLAMVDDLAAPESADPIARVSTRVACSVPCQAQTTLDPRQMRAWISSIAYGHHVFLDRRKDKAYAKLKGDEAFQYFYDRREALLLYIKDFSACAQASTDDPPMQLSYGGQKDHVPATDGGNATHHPKFGEHLCKKLKELGVECTYWADDVKNANKRYHGWGGDATFICDHLLPAEK